MPKKRIKKVQSIWSARFSECNAEIASINKEKDLIVPIITMIMRKEIKNLEAEYNKYLSHNMPKVKLSSDEGIDSFVDKWKDLDRRLKYQGTIMDHLNGITDKAKYDGKGHPAEVK